MALTRCFSLSKSRLPFFSILNRLRLHSSTPSPPFPTRSFCYPPAPKNRNPKLVNFSLPSDSESDSEPPLRKDATQGPGKSKIPPPYNPFDKKPAIEEPEDPKNLQEVFARIREDGLMSSAVKMFDGLSQDGLTHEALELFSQIKDRGQMPDVVAHTAVMEAYADAGQPKEAHKVYLRMRASGVLPNAYTYRVIVRGLSESGEAKMVKEAGMCVREMIGRGMRPNAGTVVAVFEGLVGAGMEGEGRGLLEMVKEEGVAPEEGKVREALNGKRGPVYRTLMNVLYGK